jgi:hypothetical protein
VFDYDYVYGFGVYSDRIACIYGYHYKHWWSCIYTRIRRLDRVRTDYRINSQVDSGETEMRGPEKALLFHFRETNKPYYEKETTLKIKGDVLSCYSS